MYIGAVNDSKIMQVCMDIRAVALDALPGVLLIECFIKLLDAKYTDVKPLVLKKPPVVKIIENELLFHVTK